MQLEKLTASFQCVTEDLRRRFMVDGEPLLHENSIGSSPVLSSSFRRISGFTVPERPLQLSTSGARPGRRASPKLAAALGLGQNLQSTAVVLQLQDTRLVIWIHPRLQHCCNNTKGGHAVLGVIQNVKAVHAATW